MAKIIVKNIGCDNLKLDEIEKILNYKFKNKDLLKAAFSHPSAQKIKIDYEVSFEYLEFIGDRVFSLCATQLLLKKIDKKRALKNLAFRHAQIVSTENLAKIAKKFGIEKYLQHSIETISDKVFADCMEAMLGAIYLDSNYENVYLIIENIFDISKSISQSVILNPKMQLQEFAQSRKMQIPVYETLSISGPDHRKIYTMSVKLIPMKKSMHEFLDNNIINISAQGSGNSKHAATICAAENLLKKLGLV